MQSLFNQNTFNDVLTRVEALNETLKPTWGEMDVAQMVKHCQMPLLVANGKMELTEKTGFLKKVIFRVYKPIMYNDKPWPENITTPKAFKVVDVHVFDLERDILKQNIADFHGKALNIHWPNHPFFGRFSTDQWGKMQYKHLDHHLKQFGV